jgi:hypothetical protein
MYPGVLYESPSGAAQWAIMLVGLLATVYGYLCAGRVP